MQTCPLLNNINKVNLVHQTPPALFCQSTNWLFLKRIQHSLEWRSANFPWNTLNTSLFFQGETWNKSRNICLMLLPVYTPSLYLTPPPSFCSAAGPFSSYSALLSQKDSLSFMMLASTAPPRNTMCLRRGGSSMRIRNFCAGRMGQKLEVLEPRGSLHDCASILLTKRYSFTEKCRCATRLSYG